MGTGVKQKVEDEDEDEKPVKKGKKAPAEDECPSGHEFGVDTDKKDECDACDLWDACMEAKKAKKKGK